MKNLAIVNTMTNVFHKTGFKLKKHSPEILMISGVVGVVASAVMACKATLKVDEVVDETREKIEKIHTATEKGVTEAGDEYTEDDSRKDLTIIYTQTAVKFVKLYGPAVVLGALSVTSILASNNILRKRNVALAAAYTAVDKSFKEYRDRVIDRFGKEVDHQLKYNIKAETIEETVTDPETGKEKKVKKTIDVADPNTYSSYARFFDESCPAWDKDAELNLMFLRAQQRFANDKLKAKGHLFLNEVYDAIGIPRTKAGQVVGWIYNPENPVGDNFVDFGIYDINRMKNRDFVNGYERSILLDFNVDGNILDLI